MELAQRHRDRLDEVKQMVEQSNSYFQENYERYHEFVKFVFNTSLNQDDLETLRDLGKPTIEFNILESFVSRLRGEFAKQQPSLKVRAADGVPLNLLTTEFNKTIKVIEAHLRAIFFDASNDKLEYNIYSDLLAGGFSVLEVYTDYVNERSFEQNIYVDRVFDPTLCGFDPLARESHKGDGRYCYQIFPKTKKEFEREYGTRLTERMRFSKNIDGFGWSYRDEKEEIVLICDFYEKKRRKETIFKCTDGKSRTRKEYDEYVAEWIASDRIEQPPLIIKDPETGKEKGRSTYIETIVRYRFCETEMLDYVETNYKHLPLVFVDGNSVMITEGDNQYQMTRPYVYHAKGIQQLKNFAGQSLANELENLVQHKFIVALESIPKDYLEAYDDVQKMNTLVYHHFQDEKNPEVTLPPPREVVRPPIPPEITNAFRMSDEMTQVILGSYDSNLGVNKQEISGAAIAMGAIQSNNASVPYIVGYIKGLNRVAQIIVDLIPKFYRTPRSLPVLLQDGKREYEIINKQGSIYMNYDPHSLQVKVETGVNFAMQKELALKTIVSLMQASEKFAAFMNDEGLPALLDNIDIRGIDELKAKAEAYERKQSQRQAKLEEMQEQMQQMQQKMVTQKGMAEVQKSMAEAMKLMKEAQAPSKNQIDAAKLQQDDKFRTIEAQQDQEKIDMDFSELLARLQSIDAEQMMKKAELSAENARTAVESLHTLAKVFQIKKDINVDDNVDQ